MSVSLFFITDNGIISLKSYIKNDVQRIDISVLARLCYALECSLSDLIQYIPPDNNDK